MKRKNKKIKFRQIAFRAAMLLFAIITYFAAKEHGYTVQDGLDLVLNKAVSTKVEKYTPALREELERVELEEYTAVLAAVMQQESKGRGGDPMQASESAGLAPNAIKDPNLSIRQGVKHFQKAVAYGQKKKVDLPTIIQAYNMGLGYIDFVAKNGGQRSETLAKQYSALQVKKNPTLYNCGRNKDNYRYPYCYGDYTYSTKVLDHLQAANSLVEKKLN